LIKLIALDIDGTLLADDLRIPIKNIDAIKKAYNMGINIVLCTGRGASVFYIVEQLKIECSGILSNGVYIYKNVYDKKPLICNYLNNHIATHIVNYLNTNNCVNYFVVLGHEHDMKLFYKENYNDPYFINFMNYRGKYKPTIKIENNIDFSIYNVSHIGIIGKTDYLNIIKKFIQLEFPQINLVFYTASDNKEYSFLEILDKSATKGTALKKLLEYKCLDESEVITIGDNYNDISLLSIGKIRAAVANAHDDIKKIANYVSKKDNNNGAVAEVIEKFIFDSFES